MSNLYVSGGKLSPSKHRDLRRKLIIPHLDTPKVGRYHFRFRLQRGTFRVACPARERHSRLHLARSFAAHLAIRQL